MFNLSLTQGIAAFPEQPALTPSVGAPELPTAQAQTRGQGEAAPEETPRKAWDTLMALFWF